jgi:hypothetical protein
MENPATWGDVERAIDSAYREWSDDHDRGVCGYSLAMYIANRLRSEGLVNRGEEVPKLISRTLLYALIHNQSTSADGFTMTPASRDKAFEWVDRHTEPYDEMGG